MGNLGDAFKKAGLISEQELERIERNKKRGQGGGRSDRGGGGGPSRDRGGRGGRGQRGRGGGGGGGGGSGGGGPAPSPQRQEDPAIELIRNHALGRNAFGAVRFHFVAAHGDIPHVSVSGESADRLEAGDLAIAAQNAEAWLLPKEVAVRVHELDPALIRFCAGITLGTSD